MKRKTIADLALWEAKNRRKTVFAGLAVTAIMVILTAFLLRVEFTFSSIMPEKAQKVQDLNRIVDEFPQASAIIAMVEGEEADIIAAAKVIKKELESNDFDEIVSSVDISLESSFLLENGVLLEPLEEFFPEDGSADFNSIMQEFGNSGISENDFFYLNKERDAGLVFIYPEFTANELMVIKPYVLKIDETVKAAAENNNVKAGITGMSVVAKDEAVTSEQGMIVSTFAAFILIILLLVFNFRKKSMPFVAAIPLIIGIIWTLGLTALFVRRLNLMTAMYMIALMGIGIDFSIHFITAWIQEMEKGSDFYDAIYNGAKKSGAGIITGGVTSAAAFFALTLSGSSLVKELGLVAGLGILCELAAAFIFLPALLASGKVRNFKQSKEPVFEKYVTAPIGLFVSKTAYITAFIMLAAGITFSAFSGDLSVQTNIMEMEAEGLESVELQDRMVERFGQSPDGLFVISDSIEETQQIVKQLEALEEVASVDSIAMFVPSPQLQQKRLDIASTLIPYIEQAGLPFSFPEKILTVDNLPDSIKNKYFTADGKSNLITIVPAQNCWEKENRDSLMKAIEPVTDKATGLILVGDQLSQIAGRDGVIASLVALLVIFVILFIDFRNLWTTLLTVFPLILSLGTLFGIMSLAKIEFDFVNIIAVPLVIGIGIDDAVHISHRFIGQREPIEQSIRFIGRAVLLTTLTTAIGFGSFIPSAMRALRSTGIVLTLAVTLTFIFSIFFHSAMLKIVRDKWKVNLSPWFLK